jgi:hypothetical protein
MVLDIVWTSGSDADTDNAVAELIRRGAELLVPTGSTASVASKRHTSTIPIVFISVGNGKVVFLLSDFICSTINSFAEPVNVIVTPNATTPCYATTAHVLVPNPSVPGAFGDLQITVFRWKPNGTAAPNVSFDWRCRLLSIQTIL